ncbi:S1 family peptidase [Actinomadura rubrisoli]|uniref:S1 family peptidase n=1 Tax=Actinomadura rubrisoli TaxID=2530368 RepID=UPI001404981F|nr:serine protease [Actinomadura rubrisoli]
MSSRTSITTRAAAGGTAAARSLRLALAASAVALLWLGLTAPSALAEPVPPRPGGTASTMIIGGEDATGPYSFMVSLQTREGHFCGGSLITSQWVVTARHCWDVRKPEDAQLRIGSLRKDQGGTTRRIERLVAHPEGDSATHDIALLKLDRPVSGAPVPLDVRRPAGTPVRLLGWGCASVGCGLEDQPVVLQQLDSAIRQPDACTNIVRPMDPASEVCTGNPETKAGPCFGDSGGPLLRRTAAGWKLIGAFSRVRVAPPDPGEPNEPPNCRSGMGIYTDVPAHREWINSVISSAA